jgi:hypothetical protein
MNRLKHPRHALLVFCALMAASACIALPLSSATPKVSDDCVAADRMPLFGCVAGEAARQRAEGRGGVDPGMVIWNGSPIVVIDSVTPAKIR